MEVFKITSRIMFLLSFFVIIGRSSCFRGENSHAACEQGYGTFKGVHRHSAAVCDCASTYFFPVDRFFVAL